MERVLLGLAVLLLGVTPSWPQGWVVAVGGGSESDVDGSWSQAPYRAIVEGASAGQIVVLSDRAETRWIPDYLESLGASEAFNLEVASREAADDPSLIAQVESSRGVFIKGGDQWDYVRLWSDTGLAAAIRGVWQRGGVVAGTSAGAHVLGTAVFDARRGSLLPGEAIRDARHPRMSLSSGFLGILPEVLVDSHFTRRGRLVRLIPMCASWDGASPGRSILGVGIDERTALVVGPDLIGEVMGEGSVSFVRLTGASDVRLAAGRPPVVTRVAVDRLTEGFAFDLAARRVAEVPSSARLVEPPPLPAEAGWADLLVMGSDPGAADLGAARLGSSADTDPDALWLGRLEEDAGLGLLGRAVVVPGAFADADLVENRVGGLQWLLAAHPGWVGIMLDQGSAVEATSTAWLRPRSASAEPAVLVLDASRVWVVGGSERWARADAAGPRQSAALAGLEAHLLGAGWAWGWPGDRLIRTPPFGVPRRVSGRAADGALGDTGPALGE